MMTLPLYIIDAFTTRLFDGNPAAVCPLDAWPSDTLMQQIAAENNLAETAFLVPQANGWHLRWFTPIKEIELCGHARRGRSSRDPRRPAVGPRRRTVLPAAG
jgi:PhzF family phenazine biosynthesis protein